MFFGKESWEEIQTQLGKRVDIRRGRSETRLFFAVNEESSHTCTRRVDFEFRPSAIGHIGELRGGLIRQTIESTKGRSRKARDPRPRVRIPGAQPIYRVDQDPEGHLERGYRERCSVLCRMRKALKKTR